MNPYETPESDIPAKNSKSLEIFISAVIAVLSVPPIYLILFPIIDVFKSILKSSGFIGTLQTRLITDAFLTFLFLILYFSLLHKLRPQHGKFICLFVGFAMFFYWGIESDFFWNGINPMFPFWYEVNIALNDIVAAIAVNLFYSRKSKV